MTAPEDEQVAPFDTPLVEVAIPVPLRRLFSYRIPEGAQLRPGDRVAVPFHRRKVAGFAVRGRDTPPEGVSRVLSVAGRLEAHPVFPTELLTFLERAARYYMAPLGEVLRAAAPAMPKGAMKRLRDQGFLNADESLGTAIASRRDVFARRTEVAKPDRLGARQARVLAALEAAGGGEVSLTALRVVEKSARTVLRALQQKGLVITDERVVFGTLGPLEGSLTSEGAVEPPVPNAAQQASIEALVAALDRPAGSGGAFLLHGVTGSGKTEVYLRLIHAARERGMGALVLVPEIALTPQLVARFRHRFGDDLGVLHSALSPRERDDAWRRLRAGQVSLAIGARSALFAPVARLGVVIVDEEHDASFKQEDGFRYQARDMALLRAHLAGAVCVLGSATPSMESFENARRGRLTLLSLPDRATARSLPKVEIVDLRRERPSTAEGSLLLSGTLHQAITRCLDAGDQGILFLNRRGFAPSIRCSACGKLLECPSCSVALTEHRRRRELRCHYCDYRCPIPTRCNTCNAAALEPMGLGTEQLEGSLAEIFAPARIARLDRDVASGREVEKVLARLRAREVDLLVGTQMVTKGHDLPGVTLVGVILADHSLGFPDFRAAERTFQLLAQVAGRAGRGDREGRVLFQTFQPEHAAIRAAAQHDYEAFFQAETEARRELAYPPHGYLVAVRVDDPDDARAKGAIAALASVARKRVLDRVELLGPAEAPIARLRARFRYRFLLRSTDRRALRDVAASIAHAIDAGVAGSSRASVDVDPCSML